MPLLSGSWLSDQFNWNFQPKGEDELTINILFLGRHTKRAVGQKLQKRISEGSLPWLSFEKRVWRVNLNRLQQDFDHYHLDKRWKGNISTEAEVDEVKGIGPGTSNTQVSFAITMEELIAQTRSKIFLSHKGEDKKMVRRFLRALEAVGYEVWLDEKDLKAGDHLERGIRQGFEESGAAIFFITENFKDERYLKAEIDYAIAQKREREEDFRIITLAFKKGSQRIDIPVMLKNYVWKSPATELDALIEILKALPPPPRMGR